MSDFIFGKHFPKEGEPKGTPQVGEFWLVKTPGIFLAKVEVLKVGWFSNKVRFEDGQEKKVSKVDFRIKV